MTRERFERIEVRTGERSGCTVAVAVHSTALGPALGGARMWHYAVPDDAVTDAKRLAAAMTLKAAAAGLDLGGGKGVLAAPAGAPPAGELRRALLLDFGDLVEELGGAYVTAEDVGTGSADMDVIAERTSHVVGLDATRGGSGDPSPVTALGVVAAMRACAEERFGSRDLAGVHVCVIGLGHVGTRVAEMLTAAGARLTVTDIDPHRRTPMERLGARWISPEEAVPARCDVLAPCALGGVIGMPEARELHCSVVCGAANNILVEPAAADVLHERGITYAPDFIANAGGLISVYGELRHLDHARALELAAGIEGTMTSVLRAARREGITPLDAARRLAKARLEPVAAAR
ncbi:MAG: Glu/Leu/Phe/Val dehydrogenase dimerization domain-containing protein [Solirubrobacterales bacterium]